MTEERSSEETPHEGTHAAVAAEESGSPRGAREAREAACSDGSELRRRCTREVVHEATCSASGATCGLGGAHSTQRRQHVRSPACDARALCSIAQSQPRRHAQPAADARERTGPQQSRCRRCYCLMCAVAFARRIWHADVPHVRVRIGAMCRATRDEVRGLEGAGARTEAAPRGECLARGPPGRARTHSREVCPAVRARGRRRSRKHVEQRVAVCRAPELFCSVLSRGCRRGPPQPAIKTDIAAGTVRSLEGICKR